jgi:methionyl-tRNA formyltransferase
MRVDFVTHNELGLACLEELNELDADIQAVYTRPDREDISDQVEIEPFTDQKEIPLHRVRCINTRTIKSEIRDHNPELLFVVGWSQLVDAEVLDIPSIAALGMHPAPLPRGRGRAPLAWSIMWGLDETALSLFHLEKEADAGDLVGQQRIPIDIQDDAASLYEKVVEAGRVLIQEYYPKFASGSIPRTPQDDSKATWWPKREPHHGLIDWNRPPAELYDWIRGQARPYPGAFTYLDDRKITIWEANQPSEDPAFVSPGEIAYYDEGVLGVCAWEGVIELTEIEVEDEGPIRADSLLSLYDWSVGDSFENARDRMRK